MDKKEGIRKTLYAAFGALKDCGYEPALIREVLQEFGFIKAAADYPPDFKEDDALTIAYMKGAADAKADRLSKLPLTDKQIDQLVAAWFGQDPKTGLLKITLYNPISVRNFAKALLERHPPLDWSPKKEE